MNFYAMISKCASFAILCLVSRIMLRKHPICRLLLQENMIGPKFCFIFAKSVNSNARTLFLVVQPCGGAPKVVAPGPTDDGEKHWLWTLSLSSDCLQSTAIPPVGLELVRLPVFEKFLLLRVSQK